MFVVFASYGSVQLLAELTEFGGGLILRVLPPRRFPLVFHIAVYVLEERHEFFLEDFVIVRAPEPTGGTEVFEGDPTLWAFSSIERFKVVGFALHFDGLWLRKGVRTARARFIQVLLGTLFAEVKFFNLLGSQDFGQM